METTLEWKINMETYTELVELLKQPEYFKHKLPNKTNYPEFEALNYYGNTTTLFDDLTEELQRIPTPREYGQESLNRARDFFTSDTNADGGKTVLIKPYNQPPCHFTFYFEQDLFLQQAIVIRQWRSYQSFLVELLFKAWVYEHKITEVDIGSHNLMDIVMGVDVALYFKEIDYTLYIHVISASQSNKWRNKEKRNQWNSLGKFKRDFTNHVEFTYNLNMIDDLFTNINGHTVPTSFYINMKYEAMKRYAGRLKEDTKKELQSEEPLEAKSNIDMLESWLKGGLYHDDTPLTLGSFWLKDPNQLSN